MSGERNLLSLGGYPPLPNRSRGLPEGSRAFNLLPITSTAPLSSVQQPHILQRPPPVGGSRAADFTEHQSVSNPSAQMHHQSLTQQQQQQQFQRLKVEDALSYLDEVKLQFSVQPQIYNDFLDIMKEFKSQSIDTPGVIRRVSELFKGHPDLIVGFNTFLPAGYKIELNANDTISVYQPGQKVISLYAVGSSSAAGMSASGPTLSMRAGPQTQPPSGGGMYDSSHTSMRHLASAVVSAGGRIPASVPDLLSETQRGSAAAADAGQPVEFSHAITYVNKIKSRYQAKPEIYKAFLDILHAYQKEQRDLKEGLISSSKILSEKEVYSKVAALFKDQTDLLNEFGHFLPDANGGGNSSLTSGLQASTSETLSTLKLSTPVGRKPSMSYNKPSPPASVKPMHRRRMSSVNSSIQPKKFKSESGKEVTMAEASKFGSLGDFAFFDKVRKILGDKSYTDFLRCLQLYNQKIINTTDLLQMIQPFSAKMPELMKKLKELLKQKDDPMEVPQLSHGKERLQGEFGGAEIDYASCKRLGVSYRGLPSTHIQPKCSGRTALCWEVLNDTLVSFPSWSEDSSSVIKKTMAEEQIFRCEDERYQLDIVLDNINATTLALEVVQDKLNSMPPEDAAKYRLDNCLGGNSESLHRKTIQRLYKEHAIEVIEGLKRNPFMVVPMVLSRLRAKQQEWSEARQASQKNWNEQNQKYYLKSLDHQGINFKQADIKQLRSKALLLEIENSIDDNIDHLQRQDSLSPLMTLDYPKRRFLEDAASLIIHHVKRQTGINQEDKQKIKHLLIHFIPELFFLSPCNLSDVDSCKEADDNTIEDSNDDPGLNAADNESRNSLGKARTIKHTRSKSKTRRSGSKGARNQDNDDVNYDADDDFDEVDDEITDVKDENGYTLMYGNNNWYLFLKLHNMLYRRLKHFYQHAQVSLEEQRESAKEVVESTAVALGLKPPRPEKPVDYYPVLLDMIRNYLDGNLETCVYEEQLRDMFTINAYYAFTMDKLIQNIVRQLQHLVMDQICIQVTELYKKESERLSMFDGVLQVNQRQQVELAYQKKAEQLLMDENCFRIIFYKNYRQLTIALIDSSDSRSVTGHDESERWKEYVEQFVTSEEQHSDSLRNLMLDNPVILMRNVRTSKRASLSFSAARGHDSALDADMNETLNETDGGTTTGSASDLECRLPMNSFKMLYVEGSSSAHYKPGSLAKAKNTHRNVSLHKHALLNKWASEWLARNVTEEQAKGCMDWFLGRVEGLSTNASPVKCVTVSDVSHEPYHIHHIYSSTRV